MVNYKRKYTRESLLFYIRKLAFELGRTPTSIDMDKARGYPDSTTYHTALGSWKKAVAMSGVPPARKKKLYSREELLEKLRRFVKETGIWPTTRSVDKDKKMPGYNTYRARFGNLKNALKAAGLKSNN
jgi:hypothetical protein